MIEEYKFGSITIDGKIYNYDIEVCWTGEILKWWRRESHIIDFEDIKRAVEQNPEIIIIGTGQAGVAKIPEEVKRKVLSKKIELIIDETGKATEIFNNLKNQTRRIIGFFHLTC